MKRVFLIVLDSFGIGEAPDAHLFGDVGANTLRSVFNTGRLNLPTLTEMGLGCIDGVDCIKDSPQHTASVARLRELSMGKDTTTGHFEIAGIISKKPMPTYPNGFPSDIIDRFTEAVGRGVLCNRPYSGTDVIRDYGEEHLKTGKLIVYTSADSVFQIAAHKSIVPVDELYEICKKARKILVGEHGVGRVIARPFDGEAKAFVRTPERRDFSLEPPEQTMLDILAEAGKDVIGIGKIGDIFAMRGISESYPTHSNDEGMDKLEELIERDFNGLCFVNLVDFDMHYGHRQDAEGYAKALNEFDARLASIIKKINDDDVIMICADHGCDPSDSSTDHTREYVPLIIYEKNGRGENLGTIDGFSFIGQRVLEYFGIFTDF